jgi:hypothetical protein
MSVGDVRVVATFHLVPNFLRCPYLSSEVLDLGIEVVDLVGSAIVPLPMRLVVGQPDVWREPSFAYGFSCSSLQCMKEC